MGVAQKIGDLASLTAILMVSTGILGAVLGPTVLDLARVRDQSVRGFAIGVASHGIGTARALRETDEADAFSGLAMGQNGLARALMLSAVVSALGLGAS